ncbi:MAG: hypothetical protein RLZZ65_1007 [Bacteroidota bacterium]|jgi:hypothetical protein
MAMWFLNKKSAFLCITLVLLASCGHENPVRQTQFDILEHASAVKASLPFEAKKIELENLKVSYPSFGKHPFSVLMKTLVTKDTAGVFCVGQRSVKVVYQVRWATKNVLSLKQNVYLNCPMSNGPRSTTIEHLYTLHHDTIFKLDLEGSPSLLQEIQSALRKRKAPYCSAPKIEEVFPVINKGRLEVTPHYASALCDTTFVRKPIARKDLRLIRNRVFLVLN